MMLLPQFPEEHRMLEDLPALEMIHFQTNRVYLKLMVRVYENTILTVYLISRVQRDSLSEGLMCF
jgi:hypothetical protein